MTTITLRCQIGPDDRAAIETVTASSGFFSTYEVSLALAVFDEALTSPGTSYRYILAEDDETLVGYACWGRDEQTDCSYELYWIAVDNNCRGGGVGSMLLDAVESAIAGSGGGRLYIETAGRPQYQPTRSFYERRGYSQVAWLDDYFAPGDARVFYLKILEDLTVGATT